MLAAVLAHGTLRRFLLAPRQPGLTVAYRESIWRPLGYRSYYDYRLHGYGERPASEPISPQERRAFRGHAGLTELLHDINRASTVNGQRGPFLAELNFRGQDRGPGGRWTVIRAHALIRGGGERYYYLRRSRASHQNLMLVKQAMSNPGALHRREPTVSSPGGGGADFPEDDFADDEDYGEEWDESMEWDDYYFDYDEGYDWDVPYGIASSIGEFST